MSEYLKIDHEQLIALGSFIRSLRIKRNIGLREMAGKINISSAYLSNLESGKHSKANPLLLKKIAEEFNIDHLKLFKIIGYTNKDLEDIKSELRNKKKSKEDEKINKMINYMRKFSEDEFELVEKYLELIKRNQKK